MNAEDGSARSSSAGSSARSRGSSPPGGCACGRRAARRRRRGSPPSRRRPATGSSSRREGEPEGPARKVGLARYRGLFHAHLRVPMPQRPHLRAVPADERSAPGECEICGASPVEKVLYPAAIHFKGSGFYSTDYGRGGKKREGEGVRPGSSSDSEAARTRSPTEAGGEEARRGRVSHLAARRGRRSSRARTAGPRAGGCAALSPGDHLDDLGVVLAPEDHGGAAESPASRRGGSRASCSRARGTSPSRAGRTRSPRGRSRAASRGRPR